jgi:hypothetical protein
MENKKPEPGIYYDIPFPEYLEIPYFSKSMVSDILRSPMALKYAMENPSESKEAMNFGSLLDCLLFEPVEYSSRFAVRPDTYESEKKGVIEVKPWSGNSNKCKEWLAGAQRDGLTVVSAVDVARAGTIVERIKRHKTASQWIEGKYQVSIIWKDTTTGVYCKGRMDIWQEGNRIVDLKATNDPLPAAFSKTVNNFKYHVQAAMYSIGLHCAQTGSYPDDYKTPFSFIACEMEEPHDIVAYDMDSESMDCGKILFREAIDKYAACVAADSWPGYSDYAEPLSIPMWAKNKIQLEGVFSE